LKITIINTGVYNMINLREKIKENAVFLVTGGAGFIGSNLCESLLNQGFTVRCLDDLSTGNKENIEPFLSNPKFSFILGDIVNFEVCLEACKNVDYVLHQAAWGSVPRSIEQPLMYELINIKGTLNMLEASKRCLVKKFVYASSSSVYGDDTRLPKKEGNEGKVLSPYALTKATNEKYGSLYTRLYGLDTYGLRYFNVFGKRQNPNGEYAAVLPRFIKALLRNERPTIYGDGMQSRDFTYIENVIDANFLACLAPHEVAGECFNVAFGGQLKLIDIFNYLREILDRKIEPIWCPERLGDIKHSNADISKAQSLLGYYPEWDFESGIAEAIEWYKDNL